MGLRMLVGRGRGAQLARPVIHIEVALAGTVDAIGPMKARIEPLRRVRRGLLGREHIGELVAEGRRILLAVEIAALPAPIGPGAGETVEDLTRIHFGAESLVFGNTCEGVLVGDRTPEPGGNVVLLHALEARRDAGLAEIFLRQDVGRDLAELRGDIDSFQAEDDRAVGIADLARRLAELDRVICAFASFGVAAFELHAHDDGLVPY